jgi:hypothetical protein
VFCPKNSCENTQIPTPFAMMRIKGFCQSHFREGAGPQKTTFLDGRGAFLTSHRDDVHSGAELPRAHAVNSLHSRSTAFEFRDPRS